MLVDYLPLFDYLSFKKHNIDLVKDVQFPTTSRQENSDFIVSSDSKF